MINQYKFPHHGSWSQSPSIHYVSGFGDLPSNLRELYRYSRTELAFDVLSLSLQTSEYIANNNLSSIWLDPMSKSTTEQLKQNYIVTNFSHHQNRVTISLLIYLFTFWTCSDKYTYTCPFNIIFLCWNGPSIGNPPSRKRSTGLSSIIIVVVVDCLTIQQVKALAAILITEFSFNVLVL